MPRTARFEVYQDVAGTYRWRLIAPNGGAIASGESFRAKAGALRAVETIRKHTAVAPIQDLTKK